MTGGYLVLERPNAGIVLSTNARFYAIVKPLHEEIIPESWAWVSDVFRTKLDNHLIRSHFNYFLFLFLRNTFVLAFLLFPLQSTTTCVFLVLF